MKVFNSDVVDAAYMYAVRCHEKTNHMYSDHPYEYHLSMVYDYGKKYINLINSGVLYVLSACWTHDVIEDCRQTYNDVWKECGIEVAELTYALTNEKGRNRKERANAKYYEGIRNTPNADFVKICDRLANIKFSVDKKHRMIDAYRKEHNDFVQQLFRPELQPMFDEMAELLKSEK